MVSPERWSAYDVQPEAPGAPWEPASDGRRGKAEGRWDSFSVGASTGMGLPGSASYCAPQ